MIIVSDFSCTAFDISGFYMVHLVDKLTMMKRMLVKRIWYDRELDEIVSNIPIELANLRSI